MTCPNCGNDEFYAKMTAYHDVTVDEDGDLVEDNGYEDSDFPYGPFTCTECGSVFDDLD